LPLLKVIHPLAIHHLFFSISAGSKYTSHYAKAAFISDTEAPGPELTASSPRYQATVNVTLSGDAVLGRAMLRQQCGEWKALPSQSLWDMLT